MYYKTYLAINVCIKNKLYCYLTSFCLNIRDKAVILKHLFQKFFVTAVLEYFTYKKSFNKSLAYRVVLWLCRQEFNYFKTERKCSLNLSKFKS